jgi:hypothetical protein
MSFRNIEKSQIEALKVQIYLLRDKIEKQTGKTLPKRGIKVLDMGAYIGFGYKTWNELKTKALNSKKDINVLPHLMSVKYGIKQKEALAKYMVDNHGGTNETYKPAAQVCYMFMPKSFTKTPVTKHGKNLLYMISKSYHRFKRVYFTVLVNSEDFSEQFEGKLIGFHHKMNKSNGLMAKEQAVLLLESGHNKHVDLHLIQKIG